MSAVSEQETLGTQNTPTEISQEKLKDMINSSEFLTELFREEFENGEMVNGDPIPNSLYGVPLQNFIFENDTWSTLEESLRYEINYKNGVVRDGYTKCNLKVKFFKRRSIPDIKAYVVNNGEKYSVRQLIYLNYMYVRTPIPPPNRWEVLKFNPNYKICREETLICSIKTGKLLKNINGKYRINSKLYRMDDLIKWQNEME
jgi:hypothetical protein